MLQILLINLKTDSKHGSYSFKNIKKYATYILAITKLDVQPEVWLFSAFRHPW